MLSAHCHCGAVQIEIPAAPDSATQCNCSICHRLGALWAFYPASAVRFTGHPEHTDSYSWGRHQRHFVRCRTCGCTTHCHRTLAGQETEIEVNLRLFDPQALGPFRLRHFDGAETWQYIEPGSTPTTLPKVLP